MSTGEPYDYECQLRRFDGVYRWFQVRGNSVRNSDGNITRWNVLHTDIDERKRAEDERWRANEQLAMAQRLSATGSFTTDLVADRASRRQ
jgi:PAS fold